jgi:hypothetical protein
VEEEGAHREQQEDRQPQESQQKEAKKATSRYPFAALRSQWKL